MAGQSTSKQSRRRLGRGLGSLISAPVAVAIPARSTVQNGDDAAAATASQALREVGKTGDAEAGLGVRALPVESVRPNPNQPRKTFDDQALAALANSIRTAGLMQPIVVRPTGADMYEVVAGERRWRAARMIGLERIPAVVREIDDHEAAEWSLIENIQREDLNPIERAQGFRRLIEQYGMTHQQVAERIGIDRSNVANHLRLLELDSSVRDMVMQGMLSLGHARALLAITNTQQRQALAAKAVRDGWTVRAVEQQVRRELESGADVEASPPAKSSPRSAHLNDLERRLGEHLGTKVHIKAGRGKGAGRLMIQFYSNEQFEGILDRLGFSID